MGFFITDEVLSAPAASTLETPYPLSAKAVSGHRYYMSEIGRWVSRDLMAEEAGPNLYSFLQNAAVNAADYLGYVAQQGECITLPRKLFEKWLADHGLSINWFVIDQLDRGCVGLTCIDEGMGGMPEDHPDTKCWLSEIDATQDCQRCKRTGDNNCCTVFTKQGKWKHGKPPRKRPDGSISCHEVDSSVPGKFYWNYVLSKQGWYFTANHSSKIVDPPQTFTICKSVPQYDDVPDSMWGTTCHKANNGIPTP